MANPPATFLADGYFSGYDDESGSPRERGPGDSNYELTFTLRDLGGESGTDWDAPAHGIEPEPPSSDEIPAVIPTVAGRVSDAWHVRFVESWGRVVIGAALGLIAVALPVIVYLLWREIGGGRPSPTLIAGFACAIGLLMISIPMMLVATCLTELVRDVRRLREHLERRSGIGG